jgi:hypothetical protein
MSQHIKNLINISSREFFQVFLVTYLLLTLMETFREGFVSNFFNMNYLLLIVLVSGVAMVLTEPEQKTIKLHKLAARAVIVLTSRQERREMIAKKRAAIAAAQAQLKRKRVADMQMLTQNIPLARRHDAHARRPLQTSRQKRRMDGFL